MCPKWDKISISKIKGQTKNKNKNSREEKYGNQP